MIERWARRHERAFLTSFFLLLLTGIAGLAVRAAVNGYGVAFAAAWLGGFVVTVVAMIIRHRSGRLILRRARDRERQLERNQASLRFAPVVVAAVIGVSFFGEPARDVALAVLCGIVSAIAPVLLWIAFALRPDQRPGEDL